jgi:glucokinase
MTENRKMAGIDIGGTSIKFGIFDSNGEVLFQSSRPTEAIKGANPLMHKITNIAEQLLLHASEEDIEIKNIGVGSPGGIDTDSGIVVSICPNIPNWKGVDIKKPLQEHLNIPVFVDNDANCMALAEMTFGAAIGYGSAVCLTVGTGIGGALIMDGKIYRGKTFTAGELGHMPIDQNGEECSCGNVGCLETLCSSKAIFANAKRISHKQLTPKFKELLENESDGLTIKKIFSAYEERDENAVELIENAAYSLAVGLSGVVNMFNPQAVIIGGGVTQGSEKFVELVEDDLKKLAFDSAVEKLVVSKAKLGNNAGFIGAGLLGKKC